MDISRMNTLKTLLEGENLPNLSKTEFGSILRKISVITGSSKSSDMINNYYCKKYQLFVDDLKQGLNNYADVIMQENQSTQNYSKSWTSKLSPDRFISTAQKVTSNLPLSDQEPFEMKLKFAPDEKLKRKVLGVLQESETSDNNNSTQFKNESSTLNEYECAKPTKLSIGANSTPPSISFREDATTREASMKPTPSNFNNTAEKAPNSLTSAFFRQMGQSSSSSLNKKAAPKPLVLNKKPTNPSNKRQSEESINDETQEVCPFKTAREQLILNKVKGDSSSANYVHQYGVSKRSLGTRRGLRSSFVPPIVSNGEDNHRGEDRSPVNAGQIGSNQLTAPANSSGNSRLDELMLDERLKSFEPKLVELIINEIMDNGPQVTWDDIAGLEFVKNTIKEIVIFPMLRPDLFTGLRGPPKGLLLFGPPGTGKTLIGKCVAAQSRSTFFSVSASSLTSKWVGEGEKLARALFVVARIHQPAVIFIDEIDSLLSQRSDQEHESSRRIKTEFLIQLDGVSCEENERLLLIGATNRPQEIDEAARRRFVKRLYIPLPTSAARRQIVERLILQHSHQLTDSHVEHIVNKSEGYSGADVTNLCREAAMGPIRNISFETLQNIMTEDVRGIELRDFEDAFGQVRASVSKKDLNLYVDWNGQFGSYQITHV